MPRFQPLEFPSGRPAAYTVLWAIAACAFVTSAASCYLIPKYWSAATPDAAHSVAIRFNGVAFYVSTTLHWFFMGSFAVTVVAIAGVFALGKYYQATGVAIAQGKDTANDPV